MSFSFGFTKIHFGWLSIKDEDYPATELNNGILSQGWQSSRHVSLAISQIPSSLSMAQLNCEINYYLIDFSRNCYQSWLQSW